MREAQISIADSQLSEMGIESLVSLAETAGIWQLTELACYGDSSVVQIEVREQLDESELDALEYVGEYERAGETGRGYIYVIAFTAPELSSDVADRANELVGTCEPDVTDDGVRLSLSGPQSAIAETIRGYESAGVSSTLERLGSYRTQNRHLDELTDRQREVIETAFELGYYEVPREVSSDAVAAELGLDPSTVTEHLQRAERNLLSSLLSAE